MTSRIKGEAAMRAALAVAKLAKATNLGLIAGPNDITGPARFVVQYGGEGGEWVDCYREDLTDGHTTATPKAIFATRTEAEDFILFLCGLMHCGGNPDEFRVMEVR